MPNRQAMHNLIIVRSSVCLLLSTALTAALPAPVDDRWVEISSAVAPPSPAASCPRNFEWPAHGTDPSHIIYEWQELDNPCYWCWENLSCEPCGTYPDKVMCGANQRGGVLPNIHTTAPTMHSASLTGAVSSTACQATVQDVNVQHIGLCVGGNWGAACQKIGAPQSLEIPCGTYSAWYDSGGMNQFGTVTLKAGDLYSCSAPCKTCAPTCTLTPANSGASARPAKSSTSLISWPFHQKDCQDVCLRCPAGKSRVHCYYKCQAGEPSACGPQECKEQCLKCPGGKPRVDCYYKCLAGEDSKCETQTTAPTKPSTSLIEARPAKWSHLAQLRGGRLRGYITPPPPPSCRSNFQWPAHGTDGCNIITSDGQELDNPCGCKYEPCGTYPSQVSCQ